MTRGPSPIPWCYPHLLLGSVDLRSPLHDFHGLPGRQRAGPQLLARLQRRVQRGAAGVGEAPGAQRAVMAQANGLLGTVGVDRLF